MNVYSGTQQSPLIRLSRMRRQGIAEHKEFDPDADNRVVQNGLMIKGLLKVSQVRVKSGAVQRNKIYLSIFKGNVHKNTRKGCNKGTKGGTTKSCQTQT